MSIIKWLYKKRHPNIPEERIPERYRVSLWEGAIRPVRKYLSVVIIPTIPFNCVRVCFYRLIGYKIGKKTHIGMRCYLDDMCYDKMVIGDNVTISYGVYFACHGRNQQHNSIVIKNGAYIGMRASIISPENIEIGENAVIGAETLVNKSVPAGATAVGIPCRIISKNV